MHTSLSMSLCGKQKKLETSVAGGGGGGGVWGVWGVVLTSREQCWGNKPQDGMIRLLRGLYLSGDLYRGIRNGGKHGKLEPC